MQTESVTKAKVLSSICGFSRMGPNRELKKRVETFWTEQAQLRAASRNDELSKSIVKFEKDIEQLQIHRWEQLKATGIDIIPSGDYSLYDHVLDCAFLFNAIPQRYKSLELKEIPSALRVYFAMARGLQETGVDVAALPMVKWFDTNYHYIVPELTKNQQFSLNVNKPLKDFLLAKSECNLVTKPVLLGPITFLHLSHVLEEENRVDHLKLLPSLLSAYAQVIRSLVDAGAQWIQIDEPVFALCLDEGDNVDATTYHDAFGQVARALHQATNGGKARLIFTTYFNGMAHNLPILRHLPDGTGIHLDLVRAPEQLDMVLDSLPDKCFVSLGLVDGRNIWLTPLQRCNDLGQMVLKRLGPERVLVGTSCSLLHVPHSLETEKLHPKKDTQLVDAGTVLHWLSFGIEKCVDVTTVAKLLNGIDCAEELKANNAFLKDHLVSPIIHNSDVKKQVAEIKALGVDKYFRKAPYSLRRIQQTKALKLPVIPTTTIGSFPQSVAVRQTRSKYTTGKISEKEYLDFIHGEVEQCIRFQEEIGLDVLVHGESERKDMVEFFGEYLRGLLMTANGWVQSYGTRCVKPPVIYGDVQRSKPMTVEMLKFAQSLTSRPVKGMLTGPTTILKWSFVRNDQSFEDTVFQIALALRDEVSDLEKAGIKCIQMDEPAFREGLPLEPRFRNEYLKTSVQAFKICTGSVGEATQIYSHMCYSEFGDIFTHIAELDADVLCIECSRSELSLLSCFERFGYPLMVGPGLYDIHSPRVPTVDELRGRLLAMLKYIPADRMFANPDCGLKTRDWPETKAALKAMVDAVKDVRQQIDSGKKNE